jgi:hypothetical protein
MEVTHHDHGRVIRYATFLDRQLGSALSHTAFDEIALVPEFLTQAPVHAEILL